MEREPFFLTNTKLLNKFLFTNLKYFTHQIMLLISPSLDNLETEKSLIFDMKSTFESSWKSVNFGEHAWKMYIDFCAGKTAVIDPNLWTFAFLQIR